MLMARPESSPRRTITAKVDCQDFIVSPPT
jgi:hypothetical protein